MHLLESDLPYGVGKCVVLEQSNTSVETSPCSLEIPEVDAIRLLGADFMREIDISPLEGSCSTKSDHSTLNNSKFVPTARISGAVGPPISDVMFKKAIEAGLTLNSSYRGKITNFDIENAATTPEDNCALYVTNIHPQVMYDLKLFFRKINTGKVFSFHLSPPEDKKCISTCAAFLTFMNGNAAERFMSQCSSTRGICIGSCRLRAVWNRKRIGPSKKSYQSRVLEFSGPPDEISLEGLETLFASYLYYDIVAKSDMLMNDQRRVVIMEFGSVGAQAESAYMCFEKYFGNDARFTVSWGRDPCEPI